MMEVGLLLFTRVVVPSLVVFTISFLLRRAGLIEPPENPPAEWLQDEKHTAPIHR
jgi:hypothetical protein